MMHSAFRHAVFGGAALLLLAACGDSDSGGGGGGAGGGGGNPGGGGGTVQSQVSPGFATAFDQGTTADPVVVTSTSLPPVSFTTDPIALP